MVGKCKMRETLQGMGGYLALVQSAQRAQKPLGLLARAAAQRDLPARAAAQHSVSASLPCPQNEQASPGGACLGGCPQTCLHGRAKGKTVGGERARRQHRAATACSLPPPATMRAAPAGSRHAARLLRTPGQAQHAQHKMTATHCARRRLRRAVPPGHQGPAPWLRGQSSHG